MKGVGCIYVVTLKTVLMASLLPSLFRAYPHFIFPYLLNNAIMNLLQDKARSLNEGVAIASSEPILKAAHHKANFKRK